MEWLKPLETGLTGGSSTTSSWRSNGPELPVDVHATAAPLTPVADDQIPLQNSLYADGLWPDYNVGTWPACCDRSQFNEKEPRECAGARNVVLKETSKSSCPKYVILPEFVSKGQKLLPDDLLHRAI